MFMDKNLVSNNLKVDCKGKFELEDFSNPGKPQIYDVGKKMVMEKWILMML